MSSASASVDADRVKVRAAHILVKTEAQADALLERLKQGEAFTDLAMWESQCPSGKEGGDLGWFGKGQMVRTCCICIPDSSPGDEEDPNRGLSWWCPRCPSSRWLASTMLLGPRSRPRPSSAGTSSR
jgi:hypothetical protein